MDDVAPVKSTPIIVSFNAGEWSPLMYGRVDLKTYANACRKMRNMIPSMQGPARRRPGTHYVASVRTPQYRTWLTPFVYSRDQAYVIEWGNLVARFFASHGVVGAPYELAIPYQYPDYTYPLQPDDATATRRLRWTQSGDIQYLACTSTKPQKLTRTGAATFSIAALTFWGGPFDDIDPFNSITMYASAQSGAVTLTASSAVFQPDIFDLNKLVGVRVLLEQKNIDIVKMWEPGKSITAGDTRRSDGKNYVAQTSGVTGTIKPTHTLGQKYDGDNGVLWIFSEPGYGWGVITAIASGTSATMTVESYLPAGVVGVGNASTRWAFSPFGRGFTDTKWPTEVSLFRERLCYAMGRRLWGSESGNYESWKDRDDGGVVTADMGFRFEISSPQGNFIRWMQPLDLALMVGTDGDEWAINETVSVDPFGPGNAKAVRQSGHGSKAMEAYTVGEGVLFVQAAARKVRDLKGADSVQERWTAHDMTALAPHITKPGIVDWCFQQEPDAVMWAALSDGKLIGFTINREHEVRAWHQHRIGGYADVNQLNYAAVEALAAIPAPSSDKDEVWMIVKRYINGASRRYVEYMGQHHEEGDDPEDAVYLDSMLTLNNVKNASITVGVFAALPNEGGIPVVAGSAIFSAGDVGKKIHYRYYRYDSAGKKIWYTGSLIITAYNSTTSVTVGVVAPLPVEAVSPAAIPANGWRMTTQQVSGLTHLEGQFVDVMIDGVHYSQQVVAGASVLLPVAGSKIHVGLPCPAIIQPMPISVNTGSGTGEGKTKRISKVALRFHQTLHAKYGRDEDFTLDEMPTEANILRDNAPALFDGDVFLEWPDGYDLVGLITVIQETSHPCNLVAVMPVMDTSDDP